MFSALTLKLLFKDNSLTIINYLIIYSVLVQWIVTYESYVLDCILMLIQIKKYILNFETFLREFTDYSIPLFIHPVWVSGAKETIFLIQFTTEIEVINNILFLHFKKRVQNTNLLLTVHPYQHHKVERTFAWISMLINVLS